MNKTPPWLRYIKLGVLLGVPFLAFLYAYQFTDQNREEIVPFKTFQVPETIVLDPLSQKEVELPLRAPITVVNFWATWCPPCVSEFPAMLELQRQLEDKGVEIVFVSVDETWDVVEKFQQENVLDVKQGRQFWDPKKIASEKFNSTKFPETFVIRQDGWVVEKIVGEQRWTRPVVVRYFENLAEEAKKSLASVSISIFPSSYAQKQLLHEDDKKTLELLKKNIDTASKNLLGAQAAVKQEQRSLNELKLRVRKEEEELSAQKAQVSALNKKQDELKKALLKSKTALTSELQQRKNVVTSIKSTQKKIAQLEKQLENERNALVEQQKSLSTRNQNVESLEKANDVLNEDLEALEGRMSVADKQADEKRVVLEKTQKEERKREESLSKLEKNVENMEKEVDKQKAKLVEFEEILNK